MATLKPTTPLLAPNKGLLKPTSPLRPKTAPKTPISHPQRRWRFQLRLSLHEQRRQGFHTTGPPGLRPSSYPQPQCAQNADHLARNTPISPIFTEVVRSLGASLPSTGRLEGAGGTCRGAGGRWRGLAGHTRSTGAAGVEGAGGTAGPGCGAGGRWRGLAGLRDDAPSEARGADGSRAGRRPPAHTAAGPSGARNTREATSNTSGATSNRQPPQAQQSGPEPLGSGPPSMLSGDQRTTRVSSARPPCRPCRSSRR